ncbi:MAG TPA: hypothetical protein EYO32_00725, partial [Rhodospirillales bacterium]|nr:hypothetical protein [Rhodospirillales bacterium]
MKITILANRDLASCIALNRLFPLLKDHELCIFLSAKVGKYDRLPQALLDLKFYGSSPECKFSTPNLG